MPSGNDFGLDDDEALAPSVLGASKPKPEDSVTIAESGALEPPPKHVELLAESKVLGDTWAIIPTREFFTNTGPRRQPFAHIFR